MDDHGPIDDLGGLTSRAGGEQLVADLRAALLVDPDPIVAQRHIEAMVAAAPEDQTAAGVPLPGW